MNIITFESEAYNELIKKIESIKEHIATNAENDILDGKDLCKLLKISIRSLQNYRDSGLIPFHKIGHKILYKRSQILESMEKHNVRQ